MPVLPALIAGGASLIGGAVNAFSQGSQNRASRQFEREQYERQYNNNLEFWRMQNAYNDPSAQMQRLRDANLNPNMVYGQNSGAASGNAQQIKTPSVQSAQFTNPQFGDALINGANSAINQYYDTQIKKAQHDNLRVDNTVKWMEARYKADQSNRSRFDLQLSKDIRKWSMDAARENARKIEIGNNFQLSEWERRDAANAQYIRSETEKILASKVGRRRAEQDIRNMKKDGVLKDMEIELRKYGLTPSSPYYIQMIARMVDEYYRREIPN